jgi:arylsulfatase A-like enzyme
MAVRELDTLISFVTSRCNSLCRTRFYGDELNSEDDLTSEEIGKDRVDKKAVLGLAVAVLLFVLACGRASPPPSFILISLDTTRADHLGVYGYGRDTTPFLDELARRAFIFEQAIAPSQNTLVSHASLLTGLFPGAHGATPQGEGRAIDPAFTTLAEDLAAHGYQTAAFLAHPDWLSVRFGFDQGFGTFDSKYRSADVVLRQAERWLSSKSLGSPYFLFLHLYDLHSDWGKLPYDAPQPFRGEFATEEFDVKGMRASDYLGAVNRGSMEVTPAEVDVLRDQYDEGLAYVDHQLKLFLDSVAGERLERAWIFILADHGEGFMEHGKLLHTSLHDEVVRIPLLVVPPADSGEFPQTPVRIGEQVGLVDVRPTVLTLAGLRKPTDIEGTDLVPCMRSEDECASLPAPLSSNAGDTALRFQRFKLLRENERDVTHFYNLEEDPGEQTDLGHRPEMRERMRELQTMLDTLVARQVAMRRRILQGAASPPVEKDPEAEERLRSLGYVR